MVDVIDYNVSAALNNSPAPNGWPEGQSYASINNCGREMQAADARDLQDRNGTLTTTGTAPDYALTLNRSSVTTLTGQDGLIVGFRCHANNSGAATTLNINAIGATSLTLPDGSAPTLIANSIYQAIYDETNSRWQMLSATTPELAVPGFTNETSDRTLGASDVDGDAVTVGAVTGSPIVFTVPSGLAVGGRIKFFNSVNAGGISIRNTTGAGVIYRSDGGTAITNGNTETVLGVAYTLIIQSSTRLYLLDY